MYQYFNNISTKEQSNKFTLLVNQIAQQTGLQPKVYGKGFLMRCPAHNDSKPSFTVSEADYGKILMYCFYGCSLDEMCQALNITKRYLFPSKNN